MPSWISRLAIIYANLCLQFQKLQALPNILIYDIDIDIDIEDLFSVEYT